MVRFGVRAHKWETTEILAEAAVRWDRMLMSQSPNFISEMYYYTYRGWYYLFRNFIVDSET